MATRTEHPFAKYLPPVRETYRITGVDGATGLPFDETHTFESMPGIASAREVAQDWAYGTLDKGRATLELIP